MYVKYRLYSPYFKINVGVFAAVISLLEHSEMITTLRFVKEERISWQ